MFSPSLPNTPPPSTFEKESGCVSFHGRAGEGSCGETRGLFCRRHRRRGGPPTLAALSAHLRPHQPLEPGGSAGRARHRSSDPASWEARPWGEDRDLWAPRALGNRKHRPRPRTRNTEDTPTPLGRSPLPAPSPPLSGPSPAPACDWEERERETSFSTVSPQDCSLRSAQNPTPKTQAHLLRFAIGGVRTSPRPRTPHPSGPGQGSSWTTPSARTQVRPDPWSARPVFIPSPRPRNSH